MPEITPEVRAQLDEQKKQCPFCKILKGEIPSDKVYEDKEIFSILDINPWTKGHMLLMPKEHYPIMPYIPPETFKHMFGMLPKITKSLKSAMLSTGTNVFIAKGGIAGQQSPHFLIHLLPREPGDKISKFYINGKEENLDKDSVNMLSNNLPIMMNNHFSRNPAEWHTNNIITADHLTDIKENNILVYEDEKALVISPSKPMCKGHLIIYSQEEESEFEKLNNESASHLFFTASFAATAVFEGLQAQGSNILLKSGISDDNKNKLEIHIFPRWPEDGLDLLHEPLKKKQI